MRGNRLIFTTHAIRRMFARGIGYLDVKKIVESGNVIEAYHDDTPYPSRLLMGWVGERPIHAVTVDNHEDDQTVVITVYEPDLFVWEPGFERRRKQ